MRMHKGFISVLIFAVGLLFLEGNITAFAQSSPLQQSKEEKWRAEREKEFEEWRKSIPDYEKRLYSRVKKINSRVIRVQNIVIASFFVLLIFNGFLMYLLFQRVRNRIASDRSDKGGGVEAAIMEGEKWGHQREPAGKDRMAIAEISERQREIVRKIKHIKTYLEDYEEERSRLSSALTALEDEVSAVQSGADALSKDSSGSREKAK